MYTLCSIRPYMFPYLVSIFSVYELDRENTGNQVVMTVLSKFVFFNINNNNNNNNNNNKTFPRKHLQWSTLWVATY